MSLFPETIQAYLAGRKVQATYLVKLDFLTTPLRVWTGNGILGTPATGEEWAGLGTLGGISGLEQAVNGQAPETTLTLSGIDKDLLNLALDDYDVEVRNRTATVFIQFFTGEDDAESTLVDAPYGIWSGRMRTPTFIVERKMAEVRVAVESLFSLRSRPNFGMYTDRDQQKRFPEDRGFDFVGLLQNKVVTWPDF